MNVQDGAEEKWQSDSQDFSISGSEDSPKLIQRRNFW